MRDRPNDRVEAGRIGRGAGGPPGSINGAFEVTGPSGRKLLIISDDGRAPPPDIATGWEHVSVSGDGKHPPNWSEMCFVKDCFWRDEETVLQFHPKRSAYVNIHPGVLHLWRKVGEDHPLPPTIAV
jgi:hypothetical protein